MKPTCFSGWVAHKAINQKVKIICHEKDSQGNEHGFFLVTPGNFLYREVVGCPKCAMNGASKEEGDLYNWLIDLLGSVSISKKNRNILPNNYELDIYIFKKNIAIEFDGLFWHSEKSPGKKDENYHLWKTEECQKKGIRLVHIFEDEWLLHEELVKDKLSYILGCSKDKKKIGARKCEIREIYKPDSDTFLEKNHIQGKANASVYLGAFYQGKLVSVMLFKKTGKEGEYELNRFASDIQYVIQGIASKLLKYFIKMGMAKSIISFADRRWTDEKSNLYTKLGFKKVGYVRPTYWYTKNLRRIHKFNFRKQILCKKYPDVCNMSMTELEMTKKLGWYRIYDCGLIKYELNCS